MAFKYFLVIHFTSHLHTDFTDAIAGDWGGRPFVDLRNGWQHALDKYPEVCI